MLYVVEMRDKGFIRFGFFECDFFFDVLYQYDGFNYNECDDYVDSDNRCSV